jgi:hypothetical protein
MSWPDRIMIILMYLWIMAHLYHIESLLKS